MGTAGLFWAWFGVYFPFYHSIWVGSQVVGLRTWYLGWAAAVVMGLEGSAQQAYISIVGSGWYVLFCCHFLFFLSLSRGLAGLGLVGWASKQVKQASGQGGLCSSWLCGFYYVLTSLCVRWVFSFIFGSSFISFIIIVFSFVRHSLFVLSFFVV